MGKIEEEIMAHRANNIAHMASQFAANEEEVEKAVETNPFAEYEDSLQKSDIMSALSYDSPFKVAKTGKELKEQVNNVILPELNAELAAKKVEADNCLKECGQAPTHDCPEYWCGDIKMDVGYKTYEWDETYYHNAEEVRLYPTLSASDSEEQKKRANLAENKEQAYARTKYNDCVRAICNIMVDIKACEIVSSVSDSKTFELTPKQIIALKF